MRVLRAGAAAVRPNGGKAWAKTSHLPLIDAARIQRLVVVLLMMMLLPLLLLLLLLLLL